MTSRDVARQLLLAAVVLLSGCIGAPIKFDDLGKGTLETYELDSSKPPYDSVNRNRCTLAQGGPRTTQGHALCNALIRVDHRQQEIQKKVMSLGNERFDYSLMFLATASAAALAAQSHISTLQALGIASAAALGLKSYAAVPGRRSAYMMGNRSLSCVREATEGLLWDDRWYFSLRTYRGMLSRAHAKMTQYASALGSNDPLYARYEALDQAASASLALADEAVAAYGSLGTTVDARRVELIATMRARVESSRADIDTIVASIQNAEAVKQVQNQAVDSTADEVSRTAALNAVNPARPQLIEEIAAAAEAEPDARTASGDGGLRALSALDSGTNQDGLRNSIATAAYAMQRIADIAPRYVKARNTVQSCVYP